MSSSLSSTQAAQTDNPKIQFQSSYRKYRPAYFSDVVGQNHIVTTLKNQVISQNFSHAYLFCGTRGTGKTSIAKIFSRAINCENPNNGEPCDICPICINSKYNSVDIIEMDAASNNGVDEIRDLRDKIRFAPLESKHKIYIIDEVHMLSTGAFNALLKTLEEPPEHAIFILATTEQQKIPATILSRCQRYEFKRISLEQIILRLKFVLEDLGVCIEYQGLLAIAHAAQGGMRDALSLADQCIAFSDNTNTINNLVNISYTEVLDVLGSMSTDFMFQISNSIINANISETFIFLDEIINNGRDISVFAQDLILHFRAILLINPANPVLDGVVYNKKDLEQLLQQKKRCTPLQTVRIIELVSASMQAMRTMIFPRIALETALIKACESTNKPDFDELSAQIQVLQNNIKILEENLSNIKNSGILENNNTNNSGILKNNNINKKAPSDLIIKNKNINNINLEVPENIKSNNNNNNNSQKYNSEEIYNYLLEKLNPAIKTILTLGNSKWGFALSDNFLDLIAPKDCTSSIFNAMKNKVDSFTESISKKYPGIIIRVQNNSENTTASHDNNIINNSQNNQSLTQNAINIFGEENIIFD